jgi:catalase
MVHHFTQADEDYGRRVKEGIEAKMKEMENMKDEGPPGREAGEKSKYGTGGFTQQQAAKDAVDKGHEADPY